MPPKSIMSRYSFISDCARGEFGSGIVDRLAGFLPRGLARLGKRKARVRQGKPVAARADFLEARGNRLFRGLAQPPAPRKSRRSVNGHRRTGRWPPAVAPLPNFSTRGSVIHRSAVVAIRRGLGRGFKSRAGHAECPLDRPLVMDNTGSIPQRDPHTGPVIPFEGLALAA